MLTGRGYVSPAGPALRVRCLVHAPRPPSVAAERGGTCGHPMPIAKRRAAGGGVSCLTASSSVGVRCVVAGQAGGHRHDRAGNAEVVPPQPPGRTMPVGGVLEVE